MARNWVNRCKLKKDLRDWLRTDMSASKEGALLREFEDRDLQRIAKERRSPNQPKVTQILRLASDRLIIIRNPAPSGIFVPKPIGRSKSKFKIRDTLDDRVQSGGGFQFCCA